MSDDWKGEHHIKRRCVDRAHEGRRVMSMVWHEKRRRAGIETPNKAAHNEWRQWALYRTRPPEGKP